MSRHTRQSPPPDGTTDLGLFGPDSVTWRVAAEPVLAVAGLRALFLQSLHPVVVAGFDVLSDYRRRPWLRLLRAIEYVSVLSFGTTGEAHAASRRLRQVHARGWTDPGTGTTHRLDDPDLLLWVHCGLVDSFLEVTVRAGLALTPGERDAYVAEQVRAAELVGIDPAAVPRDTASLARYYDGMQPALRVTPAAVEAVSLLLAMPLPLRAELLTPARAGYTTLSALAFASLPRWARDRFPLPVGVEPLTQVGVTAGLRSVRAAGRVVRAVAPPDRLNRHETAARRRAALRREAGRSQPEGSGAAVA